MYRRLPRTGAEERTGWQQDCTDWLWKVTTITPRTCFFAFSVLRRYMRYTALHMISEAFRLRIKVTFRSTAGLRARKPWRNHTFTERLVSIKFYPSKLAKHWKETKWRQGSKEARQTSTLIKNASDTVTMKVFAS